MVHGARAPGKPDKPNGSRLAAIQRPPRDGVNRPPLRVALLGLTGTGADCLAAIRAHDAFRLVAIGEPDAQVRRALDQPAGIRAYEDMRSLIVECGGDGLDLIFVSLAPYASHELVALAGQRGIGVFHKPPFARTVAEARELLSAFPDDGAPFVVPRFWHYDKSCTSLLDAESHIGPIRAVAASVATEAVPTGWRGDSVRSGGGVLLNGAYEWLDLMISMLGVPETVYCECTRQGLSGSTKTYDTEDFAMVTLRFRGDRIGSLIARRGAIESSCRLSLFAPDGETHGSFARAPSLDDADVKAPCLSENSEVVIHRRREPGEPTADEKTTTGSPIMAAIHAFGAALRGELRHLPAPAVEHLNTLAVVEAAYLSARTGAPESPRQFLAG